MTLVLGGAKSGKTAYAENKAKDIEQKTGGEVVYLATATAWDQEMTLRIKRHQDSRPENWKTCEKALNICEVFQEHQESAVILMDCLTLWITNLLMSLPEDFKQIEAENLVQKELRLFMDAAKSYKGELIIVSNLVELGLVAPQFLGRIFQEICGRAHQALAKEADSVVQIIAGLEQKLK